MYKKVMLSLIATISILNADGIVAKSGTWQMTSFGMDINLSAISYPPEDSYSAIWSYDKDSGGWGAFSKDENVVKLIKEKNLYREKMIQGEAFWIQAKKDIGFLPFQPVYESLPTTKGWHLVAFSHGLQDIKGYFNEYDAIKAAFVYRDGNWQYLYRTSDANYIGTLKNFSNGEGGWIYLSKDITDPDFYNIATYMSEWEDSFDGYSFINSLIKFSNGDYIAFDQNGSVVSNIPDLQGYDWENLYQTPWSKTYKISNGDVNRYYFLSQSDNAWKLYKEEIQQIKRYPNDVVEVLDENYTNVDDGVLYEHYNKSHNMNDAVKSAMLSIKDLFENGSDDAKTVLENAKNSLQSINDNDAKVALSLVNLIEILDNDTVKSVLNIDQNSFSLDGFFSTIKTSVDPMELIELSQNISGYSTNAKTLLGTFADRLKASADILEPICSDKDYTFGYDVFGKDKLNYVDIKALRGIMLAVAYKLQYIASFDLGSDEWLKKTTDGDIEYIKASADPVGFLNSGTFFVHPDQQSLTKSKNFLIGFLTIYKELLSSKYPQRVGFVVRNKDTDIRNAKREVSLFLDNLTGVSDFAVYNHDWIEYEKPQYEIETFKVNLNALFDAEKTITIDDFPKFTYNGTYDQKASEINNSPSSSNGEELGIDMVQTIYSTTNHINNVFLKYIDSSRQPHTGVDLLNEIFTH